MLIPENLVRRSTAQENIRRQHLSSQDLDYHQRETLVDK